MFEIGRNFHSFKDLAHKAGKEETQKALVNLFFMLRLCHQGKPSKVHSALQLKYIYMWHVWLPVIAVIIILNFWLVCIQIPNKVHDIALMLLFTQVIPLSFWKKNKNKMKIKN